MWLRHDAECGMEVWSWIERQVIAQVEQLYGVKFPREYVEVAVEHHGAAVLPNTFDVEKYGEAVFNRFLSYDASKPTYIVGVYEGIEERLVEGVYPFASDAFGNFICFDYRQQEDLTQPAIVFWEHEAASEDPERAIYPVARSIADLIDCLYEIEDER
ncbi:SMI1/KNR4 family protein [Tumebacillus sp. DT12]|uniref:SMI1/KNR4 family protein n=1 Tax=Tumebacillus lacus TaxID=2995335 RepID=A0ABT3WXN7_9BACL|nr:SMI1/KNR4 family protein [Tumebacillus lacus]MCX7569424.1 SMI1/KNR4 family protein [Tumebacillus lacus]